jgi:L-threonylcarbamoyladenylate synthase
VFELKGRPAQMNLPILVGAVDQVKRLGVDFNATAQALAAQFWPGPLTIVMGFGDDAHPAWLDGRVECAIRLPDFPLLQQAAEIAGPILLTSANGHGLGPQRELSAALASLHGAPDHAIDGGVLQDTPSTIVNVRYQPATIERRGAVTAVDLVVFIDAGDVAEESTWPH